MVENLIPIRSSLSMATAARIIETALQRPLTLEPPAGGTVVRIVEFGTEGEWLKKIDAAGTRGA
jgi:hypothetical protein